MSCVDIVRSKLIVVIFFMWNQTAIFVKIKFKVQNPGRMSRRVCAIFLVLLGFGVVSDFQSFGCLLERQLTFNSRSELFFSDSMRLQICQWQRSTCRSDNVDTNNNQTKGNYENARNFQLWGSTRRLWADNRVRRIVSSVVSRWIERVLCNDDRVVSEIYSEFQSAARSEEKSCINNSRAL